MGLGALGGTPLWAWLRWGGGGGARDAQDAGLAEQVPSSAPHSTPWLRLTRAPVRHHPGPASRSFQGFTCLLQLSTRRADWLVDALALRRLIGPALAPVFTDPGVVKVLHGADKDILWLQVGRLRGG